MTELLTYEHIYRRPFPSFGKPKIIGYIGLENLMYVQRLEEKHVNYDLNLQIEMAKRKPPDLDVKLTELLKFLIEHERVLNLPIQNDLKNAPFFCYRGLMTCIACTPYERKEFWKIVAILFKGNIYLCARYTEEQMQKKIEIANTNFSSWGFKFEQYIQSDTPDTQPNPNIPVDETQEFSLVFNTQLNGHSIIYGAEMDGIRCDKSQVGLPPISKNINEVLQYFSSKEFVELKTNRHIEFSRQEVNFKKYKAMKWWCQSFLTGVETILCGSRNDIGIVEYLKVYPVRDLPKISKYELKHKNMFTVSKKETTNMYAITLESSKSLKEKFWDPSVCFNFLDGFFTHVKRCLAREIKKKHGTQGLHNLQSLPLISLCFECGPDDVVHISDNYCHEDDPILLDWFLERFGKTNMYKE